jgi:hypothetical protein
MDSLDSGDKSGFNIMIAITYGLIIINSSGLRFYDQDYGLIRYSLSLYLIVIRIMDWLFIIIDQDYEY